MGSRDGGLDYSLLLDGLMAEREQGITIDVAYRYFNTDKRSFIVADTPGHEEYTRNMAVGASFADLAVILLDATKGVLPQTKRHVRICSLMGIRFFVFAVNKMDLVSYDKSRFLAIRREINELMANIPKLDMELIPVSATEGDNINSNSPRMPWYEGKYLLDYLETVDVSRKKEEGTVMPVQRVVRPNESFRGFQGQLSCGSLAAGDKILVLPSRETAKISTIFWGDKRVEQISAGQPATLQLDTEIDISRGCVLVKDTQVKLSGMFCGTVLWMDSEKLLQGKSYLLKIGTVTVPATVMRIKYRIDVNDGSHKPCKQAYKNELVVCELSMAEKIPLDSFSLHETLGRFILVDRVTNMTSGCGIVDYELRRSDNLFWHDMKIGRKLRAQRMMQKPMTLWFTGLSGSGKSTLANEIEKQLHTSGRYTMLLDGDNVRMGLNKNLGFTETDRMENIRRLAEVAKLMNDAGLIVLVAAISPYRSEREEARGIIGEESFKEIYVSTPLSVCESRDVKGLYQKARKGEIPNFTGVNSAYEVPEHPDIVIDTSEISLEEAADRIIKEVGECLKL